MKLLIESIKRLEKTPLKRRIRKRIREFEQLKNKSREEWFSELCFCILAANSKGRTAFAIQKELGKNVLTGSFEEIRDCIKRNGHRFHNNKARFIVAAREHADIKDKIERVLEKGEIEAREWLVKNIKGIGYKEASHFLRNIGQKNLAILDRHVLNLMKEHEIIKQKPSSLPRKKYLEIESKLRNAADSLKMPQAELDMYLWYMKTGDVMK